MEEIIPSMEGMIPSIFEKEGQTEHKETTINYKPIN